MSSSVVLTFSHSRTTGGEDIGAVVRRILGDNMRLEPVLDEAGAVVEWRLHMEFSTPEAAFDAAVAIRNHMASRGLPVEIEDPE